MKSASGMIFQRIFNKITMTFAVMVFVFCCSGAESAGVRFKNIEISPEFNDAPSSKYAGVSMNFAPKTKFENKWLVVRVQFNPPSERVIPKRSSVRRGSFRLPISNWVDNVNLSVRVLMKTGVQNNGRDIYVLYTGESSFWTIRLDGKKHVALMFVPAQLIDRFSIDHGVRPTARTRSNRNAKISGGVRASSKRTIRDFVIEAVFTSGGSELGRSYYNAGKGRLNEQSQSFNKLAGSVGSGMILNGSVLSRANSPWALFEPGSFEIEKLGNNAKK